MGKPTLTDRVQRSLHSSPEGARQVILTFDARDHPPYTCELRLDRRTLHVRAGRSLQAALSAALAADALSGPLPPLKDDARQDSAPARKAAERAAGRA